jgi:hypothetical protein
MYREQLRVAVGVMEQADVAETLDAVVKRGTRRQVERRAAVDRQPRDRRRRNSLKKLAAIHARRFRTASKLLVDR